LEKIVPLAILLFGIALVIVGLGGVESHIAGHFGIRGIFHPTGHIQHANMTIFGRVLLIAMGLFTSFVAAILLGSRTTKNGKKSNR
jgi:hypothetical protein